jgi:hypothetical protein
MAAQLAASQEGLSSISKYVKQHYGVAALQKFCLAFSLVTIINGPLELGILNLV